MSGFFLVKKSTTTNISNWQPHSCHLLEEDSRVVFYPAWARHNYNIHSQASERVENNIPFTILSDLVLIYKRPYNNNYFMVYLKSPIARTKFSSNRIIKPWLGLHGWGTLFPPPPSFLPPIKTKVLPSLFLFT